ncbi:MAG TPA: WXG100 family type VII secretion target [Streptosporangiaceae bacterium]
MSAPGRGAPGGELRVEPAALRRHARTLGERGDRLQEVFAELGAALAAEGRCWGGDAVGRHFEQGYERPRHAAYEAFSRLPGAIKDIGSGLETMARTYEAAEDAATVNAAAVTAATVDPSLADGAGADGSRVKG